MDVTQVLVATQSPDLSIRQQAEQQIESAKSQNLPLLMSLMATELANDTKDKAIRQAAGLVLKNCLTAKDAARQQAASQAWLGFDAAAKQQIKMAVLSTLSSSVKSARHTAAQAVSAMAFIDLPANQWPDLIQGLVSNVTNAPNSFVKQSSLEALGYICEEIEPEVLTPQSNLILTAVVQGMQKAEPDEDVRFAATQALINALEFVRTNFENEVERNYIMQTVCETVTAESKELRCAAFECCVRVVELYYDKLAPYMQALYQLTLGAIERATRDPDEDEVGQQAIEFWSTICDEELEIMEEEEDARESKRRPERSNQNFIRGALPYLVPLLLEALCKQADDDEEEWNVAMAAASCLARVALTVADEVVQHVMPFIEKHITSTDWRRREAATSAFGSILEGPSQQVLQPFMAQAIDLMIRLMRDSSVQVKDTAAWTIGRVCEHQITSISAQQWRQMTHALQPGEPAEAEGVLLAGLKDEPRVAANVCTALHSLAIHCENTRNDQSNVLSAHFVDLARALLQCTERADANENNLRTSAYEALNTTLTNAAMDTLPHIEQLLPVIASRLQASFSIQIVSNDDKETLNDLQGLLCGSLQVVTQKLGDRARPFADQLMELFLKVFGSKNATLHEEALMAVGAVANAVEADFEKYMPHFRPFLSFGLSNHEEHQVCGVAVGVVGDICRALEGKVQPYCQEILQLLLANLQNPTLNRNVKPPILSCFGDIALAVGGEFEPYLPLTMSMLQQAGLTSMDVSNADLAEYLGRLREGIFEAYTGVLQGLRADNKGAAFQPYLPAAMHLLAQVAESTRRPGLVSENLIRAAVGVMGDLAMTLGQPFISQARQSPQKDYLKALLIKAKESNDASTQQVYQWAQQTVFGVAV